MSLLDMLEQPVQASTVQRVLTSTFTSSKVYIKGWHFEDKLFYRGLNQYFYKEIKAIKIVRSNPNFLPLIQNKGLRSSLLSSIVPGFIFIFLGMRSGYMWFALIGIPLILLGLSTFFSKKIFYYGIMVETQRGDKLLDYCDNKREALLIAQTIEKYSSAPLTVLG
jgi:hypothetical protein